MKIAIGSPLYPPDIAEPAPYVKELTQRLSGAHEVHLMVYGEIPEKIEGVSIDAVSKKTPLLERLFSYTKTLIKTANDVDVLYIQNGPSVEFPALIVSLWKRTPLVIGISDTKAHDHAQKNTFRMLLSYLVRWQAKAVVHHMPLPKPEVLPFSPFPEKEFKAYEQSWEKHIAELLNTLNV